MTNDQKHIFLIAMTKDLLATLDKADNTNGSRLYVDKAKQQRKELRIHLINNGTVISRPPEPIVKKKSPNKFNHNQNWLAQ
jgi:hypothetical protein